MHAIGKAALGRARLASHLPLALLLWGCAAESDPSQDESLDEISPVQALDEDDAEAARCSNNWALEGLDARIGESCTEDHCDPSPALGEARDELATLVADGCESAPTDIEARMMDPFGAEAALDSPGQATPTSGCPHYMVTWGTLGLRWFACGSIRENMHYGEMFIGQGGPNSCGGEWWIYGLRHNSGHHGWTRANGLAYLYWGSC